MRTKALLPLATILLAGAACGGDACTSQPEVCDRRDAARLAVADPLPVWPAANVAQPVVLYVDLSQSMRGFLDPAFPTREPTDYRHVIDVIDAELSPSPIYGFGSSVRVVGKTALGTLGNKEIYADGNTQMEDVFPRVGGDSVLASTHVILGDGRRADPGRANEQYVLMRRAAAAWIQRGGTFAVAASEAPFKPVRSDPSGCRTGNHDEAETHGREREHESADEAPRCPLYAFAFIAPGQQSRVVAVLAGVFEHVFVTPMPAVPEKAVHLHSGTARVDLRLEPFWVQSPRADVARVRGTEQTSNPLPTELRLDDTTSSAGRAAQASLRGQELRAGLFLRQVTHPSTPAWQPARFDSGLVLSGADPFHPRFVSLGPQNHRYLYRIELVPTGKPSWLDDFDAETASDAVRTYGLGRLFEGFRRSATPARPVVRAFVVVN